MAGMIAIAAQNYRTYKSATQEKPNRNSAAGNQIKKSLQKVLLILFTPTSN
jgi:hypothetical protein